MDENVTHSFGNNTLFYMDSF